MHTCTHAHMEISRTKTHWTGALNDFCNYYLVLVVFLNNVPGTGSVFVHATWVVTTHHLNALKLHVDFIYVAKCRRLSDTVLFQPLQIQVGAGKRDPTGDTLPVRWLQLVSVRKKKKQNRFRSKKYSLFLCLSLAFLLGRSRPQQPPSPHLIFIWMSVTACEAFWQQKHQSSCRRREVSKLSI